MNPYTSYLMQWVDDPAFGEFVQYWDALETIVVRVYRQKATPESAADDFYRVWPWLRRCYHTHEPALRPYRQQVKAGGEPIDGDPFLLLLNIAAPGDIPGDRRMMQHLPAAREAINRYLVAQTGEADAWMAGDNPNSQDGRSAA